MSLAETTLSVERQFDGIVFEIDRHRVRLGDGTESWRDLVVHRGGVGVLARRPDGKFLLVRQYRKAVEAEVVEIVAGLLEPGETPEDTGRRELEEETGHRAGEMLALGTCMPSPGYTSEVDTLFFTETTGETREGKQDHDERVVREEWTAEELGAAIRENRITDSKTVVAWCLARERGLV